jgi:hypothetical protein
MATGGFSRQQPKPAATPHHAAPRGDGHSSRHAVATPASRPEISTAEIFMPEPKAGSNLDERIRQVVRENPEAGTLKIKQMLNSSRYGGFKISWWDVRKRLKDLGLDSKSKRLEYFRSA